MVNKNLADRAGRLYADTPAVRLNQLAEERHNAQEDMKSIVARCDSTGTMSEADAAAFDRIEARAERLDADIKSIEAAHPSLKPKLTADEARSLAFGGGHGVIDIGTYDGLSSGVSSEIRERDSLTTKALERDRSGAFTHEDARAFDLGGFVRGLINGQSLSSDSIERRALSEGVDSAGGYAVPDVLAAQVIDRLAPVSRVIEAGARVMETGSDRMYIPRIDTGISGGWRAEGASVTAAAPVFGRVTLAPKSLAVAVKLSNELLEDITEDGAAAIEREILAALAGQIDAAALIGDGTSNSPTGVLNQSGVTLNTNTTNGATAAWSMVNRAVQAVESSNADVTGLIAAPRTWATLGGLTDTTGQGTTDPRVRRRHQALLNQQRADEPDNRNKHHVKPHLRG